APSSLETCERSRPGPLAIDPGRRVSRVPVFPGFDPRMKRQGYNEGRAAGREAQGPPGGGGLGCGPTRPAVFWGVHAPAPAAPPSFTPKREGGRRRTCAGRQEGFRLLTLPPPGPSATARRYGRLSRLARLCLRCRAVLLCLAGLAVLDLVVYLERDRWARYCP